MLVADVPVMFANIISEISTADVCRPIPKDNNVESCQVSELIETSQFSSVDVSCQRIPNEILRGDLCAFKGSNLLKSLYVGGH